MTPLSGLNSFTVPSPRTARHEFIDALEVKILRNTVEYAVEGQPKILQSIGDPPGIPGVLRGGVEEARELRKHAAPLGRLRRIQEQ